MYKRNDPIWEVLGWALDQRPDGAEQQSVQEQKAPEKKEYWPLKKDFEQKYPREDEKRPPEEGKCPRGEKCFCVEKWPWEEKCLEKRLCRKEVWICCKKVPRDYEEKDFDERWYDEPE